MKNDVLYNEINGVDRDAILRTLKLIEQKIEKQVATKEDILQWQLEEIKRLQFETGEKSNTISELHTKLLECRSQSEGNRQLINKLITDIDKLQQNIDWYKRTYETRSLVGVIRDKLKHLFR